MAQINLAPQVQIMLAAKRRRRRLYVLSLSIVIIMSVVWGGLNFVNQKYLNQISDKEKQLATLKSELAIMSADNSRMNSFEARLAVLDDVLSERYSWDPFFKELERLLPVSASLTRLDADLDTDTVTVSGKTSLINDVSQTIASLQSETSHSTLFSNVSLVSSDQYTETTPTGEVTAIGYNFKLELTKSSD